MEGNQIIEVLKVLERESRKWNKPYVEEVKKRTYDPFLVLVSCILSLRTKDEVTHQASERLFLHAKTPEDILKLGEKKISELIYPVGFYRIKARNLVKISQILKVNYHSKVPDTVEELLKLPGVGRKTATLVVSLGYGKPAICVDTHVQRIANRWGLVKTKTPEETERELKKRIPKDYWRLVNSILVAFGQTICKPVSPFCSKCPVEKFCKRVGVERFR